MPNLPKVLAQAWFGKQPTKRVGVSHAITSLMAVVLSVCFISPLVGCAPISELLIDDTQADVAVGVSTDAYCLLPEKGRMVIRDRINNGSDNVLAVICAEDQESVDSLIANLIERRQVGESKGLLPPLGYSFVPKEAAMCGGKLLGCHQYGRGVYKGRVLKENACVVNYHSLECAEAAVQDVGRVNDNQIVETEPPQ